MQIDIEKLSSYLGITPADYIDIIEGAIESAYQAINTIRNDLAVNELTCTEATAHHLKGTCASIGVEEIFLIGKKINDIARTNLRDPVVITLLSELEELLTEFKSLFSITSGDLNET